MIPVGYVRIDLGIDEDDGNEAFIVTHEGITPIALLGLLELAADSVKADFRERPEEE